jgi:hypothetical protein
MTTGSGIEAPAAQQLKWSARNVSVTNIFELASKILYIFDSLSSLSIGFSIYFIYLSQCFLQFQ